MSQNVSKNYSLNDVIDATLTLLHNPKASIVLIPDPCMPCELVDTDWKSICDNGYGSYTCRGIVETIKNKDDTYTLSIRSTPDLVFSDTVKDKIKSIIEKENKKKPLSDQVICFMLNNYNIEISRRTVAKYREELGIESSSRRRRI